MQITIPIDKSQDRPVISISGLDALVDTGAECCVCNLSPAVIPTIYPVKRRWKDSIWGLAEKKRLKESEIKGTYFVIRDFQIDKLHFKNLKLFVPDEELAIAQKFIIGSAVWKRFRKTVDPFTSEIILEWPGNNLIIDMDC